jgi:hypothetical protein
MNPHKPGTQEHTIEENFLEFHDAYQTIRTIILNGLGIISFN